MEPHVWIKSITINNESKVDFNSNDIVVIVGANNCGKTLFLREINNITSDLGWVLHSKIIKKLELNTDGTKDEVREKVKSVSLKITDHNPQIFRGYRFDIPESDIDIRWPVIPTLGLGTGLHAFFVKFHHF